MHGFNTSLQMVAERICAARRVTVMTGAGISAASGVPTFRGAGGLWRSFRPEELATADAFARDPKLVWEWYDWRRGLIAKCAPNAAHKMLARWSRQAGFTLITQNVDGLHERAHDLVLSERSESKDVIRFHGSIWRLRCWDECGRPEWDDRTVPIDPLPARCPDCGGLARPAVVWFGEPIDPRVLHACDAALDCDVFLSIGTSSVVYPAAGLVHSAKRRGAFTVEINPEATDAAPVVDVAIARPAEAALPDLDALLESAVG
jgi:NAD-dependent deacetylase